MKKFLFAVDQENRELFILHREFPACLIEVIQTTPVTFRIVDLYDDIAESDLLKRPFLDDAKAFWRQHGEKMFDSN